MSDPDSRKFFHHEGHQPRHDLSRTETTDERTHGARLVACVLLVPSDAEPVLTLLEQLAVSTQNPIPLSAVLGSAPGVSESRSDRWLEHAQASKRLGVSRSTLCRLWSHLSGSQKDYFQQGLCRPGREHQRSSRRYLAGQFYGL
jgi:hypothetical protein